MEERIYIVTLKKHDDLEKFYDEMDAKNFRIALKRPISRNTHYWMSESQAEELRNDSRVLAVELPPEDLGYTIKRYSFTNNQPYTKSGNFWKDDTIPPTTVSANDFQWGHLHCAGNDTQRRKGDWGSGASAERVSDTVEVFNNGKHVDVVICDDPVSYDCGEWDSPSSGLSRFVQYQWFNELNQYVTSIDNDSQTLPTGSISYYTNSSNPEYHGVHVAGTVAGKHYGWATEANIYALQVLGTMPSGQSLPPLLIFDYLRAFHRNKPINPETGRRNPTITNHSWGYGLDVSTWFPYGLDIEDVIEIASEGVIYDANNAPNGGWNNAGLNEVFGIDTDKLSFPISVASVNADVEDAIADGVVVISSAGNDNYEMVPEGHPKYNDRILLSSTFYDPNSPLSGNIYWRRGSSPGCANGVICVGAMSNESDFRRSTYTNYGPRIDIFAPGDNILSAFNTDGLLDSKYGGQNYYYPISGTSMASPQVAGIAACLATNKLRITNADILGYFKSNGKSDDITFDIGNNNQQSFLIHGFKTFGSNPDHYGIGSYADRTGEYPVASFLSGPTPVYYYTATYWVGDYLRILHPGGLDHYCDITGVTGTSAYVMDVYDNTNDPLSGGASNVPNSTINLQEGDTLTINASVSLLSHPLYIKTALSSGTTNQVPGVYNQGLTNSGDWLEWKTNLGSAGTYYYQCSNHPSMNGQIIVHPYGTYHTDSGGFYIKSTNDTGTSNAFTQGITNAGGVLDFNGVLLWDTTGYPTGTYYCRDSADSRWYFVINLTSPPPLSSGTFRDSTCSKDSINLYSLCNNPRSVSGYNMPQKGNRTTGMVFPRPSVYHRA